MSQNKRKPEKIVAEVLQVDVLFSRRRSVNAPAAALAEGAADTYPFGL